MAVSVSAHVPSVQITAVGGQDATGGSVTLNVPLLPTIVNLQGTVTHDDPGNVNGVNLALSDNGVQFYSGHYFAGSGNVGTAPFSVPWNITAAGSHTILATVTHGNDDGTDTVDVTVVLDVVTVNQCPAAPAIAGDYMRNTLHIKSGSALWKKVITSVAGQTGSKGTLWAANACNPGYAAAVVSYVNGLI